MPHTPSNIRESRGHRNHEHRDSRDRDRRDDRQRPEPLASEKVSGAGGRKEFFLDLHENDRGRMVKISERVGQKRNTVIVGVEDLDEFILALQQIQSFVKQL